MALNREYSCDPVILKSRRAPTADSYRDCEICGEKKPRHKRIVLVKKGKREAAADVIYNDPKWDYTKKTIHAIPKRL